MWTPQRRTRSARTLPPGSPPAPIAVDSWCGATGASPLWIATRRRSGRVPVSAEIDLGEDRGRRRRPVRARFTADRKAVGLRDGSAARHPGPHVAAGTHQVGLGGHLVPQGPQLVDAVRFRTWQVLRDEECFV